MSAAIIRPTGSMTNAVRSNRFLEFNAAPGRQHSDSSQSSALSQPFGNGGTWQASSGIWGNSTIGSGLANNKRDASRAHQAVHDDFSNRPSGSGALAASSEADPWVTHATGPWNPPDSTSPTMQSHSGSTSPHLRNNVPNSSTQTLLEIQTQFQHSRPAVGHGAAFSRTQLQSGSLDSTSGPFKFAQKPSFAYHDDKENSSQYTSKNSESYDVDMSSRYLMINNGAARDSGIPTSRAAADSTLNNSGGVLANGSLQFGSIGHPTPHTPIHSQRPSISGSSGRPFSSHATGSRYELSHADIDLNEKLAGFALGRDQDHSTPSQINNSSLGPPYSPNNKTSFTPPSFPFPRSSGMWAESTKSISNFEPYSNPPFADQMYYNKVSRFAERGSASPVGSEYRRSVNSPKYHASTGTLPVSSSSDQMPRPGSRGLRIPHNPIDLERKIQGIQYAHQTQAAYMYGAQFQGQFPPQVYEYPTFRHSSIPFGYPVLVPPYPSTHVIPTRPAKDHDVGVGVRSVLLEEFRSNAKSNKRYDLKDLYNHVVEFSGDQHGSRFIQQKLESANSDEKEQVFREIQPNALQLMTDVFGNYVIQKLFEHGNQVQKRILAEELKNHVMELSLQMYGCRVVQKALEHVLADQQAELVEELRTDVLKCVKDQNGNHVIQKAIERVPSQHIQFIIHAFKGQVQLLATHPYGCRVIQRILEYCKPHDQAAIVEELHQCYQALITDQYGNYVAQHVIQHGKSEERDRIIAIVTGQLLTFSKHKFASNVVEKSIVNGSKEQRRLIVSMVTTLNSDDTSPLQLMMKDQFGNYVIQKLLAQLEGGERESFLEHIKPQLVQLKKYNYGKQIAAIEKLLFTGSQVSQPLTGSNVPAVAPIEINSYAATPMLTHGQNSPQSSGIPSTSISTVDDPAEANRGIDTHDKACPAVVINGM